MIRSYFSSNQFIHYNIYFHWFMNIDQSLHLLEDINILIVHNFHWIFLDLIWKNDFIWKVKFDMFLDFYFVFTKDIQLQSLFLGFCMILIMVIIASWIGFKIFLSWKITWGILALILLWMSGIIFHWLYLPLSFLTWDTFNDASISLETKGSVKTATCIFNLTFSIYTFCST